MVDERVDEGGGAVEEDVPTWGTGAPVDAVSVQVETGRGQAVPVAIGSPFLETVERIADDASYGGFFRVFLNGEELLDPTDAPENVEAGMRIAVTSYDKVGRWSVR